MGQANEKLMSGEAWRDFCARLLAAGESLQGDTFPQDERGRAEGYRAITRLLVYAMQQDIEGGNPLDPVFTVFQNPVTQWGGPNPDNVYLRANIDPKRGYRVWSPDASRMRQCIFSLHDGDMQLEEYGVFNEVSLHEMKCAHDGSLEIFISSEQPEDASLNWIPMHEKARIFTMRVYLSDWANDDAPEFHINCIGQEGIPPEPIDAERIVRGLDRSINWVEKSVAFWNQYTMKGWERSTPNVVNAATSTKGGADNIKYGNVMWELEDDEALLITCEEPEAEYWNWTIHTLHYLESGDWANRQTSLTGHQTHIDDDGRMRIVLAHEDPGCPNWIDTEGRKRGMINYRWVWPSTAPIPTCEHVKLSEVRGMLPEKHPTVGSEERRCKLAGRRLEAWKRHR